MNAGVRRWIFAATFGSYAAVDVSAQPTIAQVAQEPAIELPTYTVTDSRDLPPPEKWFYGRIEGFEILSNASEKVTRSLVDNLQRFAFALDVAWPVPRRQSAMPVALIICGRGGKFDAFAPPARPQGDMAAASLQFRDRETAALVIDAEARVINLVTPDMPAAGEGNPGMEVDAHQQLDREYVRFLLNGADPPLPPWFAEGLAQLFMKMQMTRTTIRVGKIEDPNLVSTEEAMTNGAQKGPNWDRDFNAALYGRRLLPMAQMFAMPADAPEARNPLGSVWAKQCYAFVHWCLYADNARHKKDFVTFMTRLSREPLTEALFKECFKMSYSRMNLAIRGYLDFTAYTSPEYRARKGEKIPDPPPFELREATQSEIGRITGGALHLAGRDAAAHLAMLAPYIRGERDSQLLAALGLQEHAMGDDARARKFLEAAARGKMTRATAYLELARLRLAEATKDPGGLLDTPQMTAVLGPLFSARPLPPALAEVYETIAEAWSKSAIAPTAGHLAVLDEGVRLFPRDVALVYQAAELKSKIGLTGDATALVALGLRSAPNGPMRAKFEALRASLPSPAPAAVPAANK